MPPVGSVLLTPSMSLQQADKRALVAQWAFDTSPVLTPLNVAILYAVGEVLIPIDPCVAALAGVKGPRRRG